MNSFGHKSVFALLIDMCNYLKIYGICHSAAITKNISELSIFTIRINPQILCHQQFCLFSKKSVQPPSDKSLISAVNDPISVRPVIFNQIGASCICFAAVSAYAWMRFCTAFQGAFQELCHSISPVDLVL